ncbi:MAG: glycosyltransferase family 4 protein [Thermoanaerobaculia bacterium]|nr:glycosyltransferase family 4 protein [Thermoanaerobaculia bacterium]
MNSKRPPARSALFVGTFLRPEAGSPAISAELAERLSLSGWATRTTSHRRSAPLRLIEIASDILQYRNHYAVAHVDLFSGRAFHLAEVATRLLQSLGKPMVVTLHGGALPAFAEAEPKRLAKVLKRAKAVVAPSSYLARAMDSLETKVSIIPNGIDVSRYVYEFRPAVQPKIVWLRALADTYDPLLAVEILHAMTVARPSTNLRMYGPDKGFGRVVQERLIALGHDPREVLCGAVPKARVPDVLGDAQLFLNTPRIDNTPVSLLEAMASGLPIVSSAVGGIPSLIDHDVDGYLVSSRDPAAFCAGLLDLTHEPTRARRLAEQARRKVESFDWSEVVPQWDHLFCKVLSTHRQEGRPA